MEKQDSGLKETLAALRRAEETPRQTVADHSLKLSVARNELAALRPEVSRLRDIQSRLSEGNQNLTEALDFALCELLRKTGEPPTPRTLFALLQRAWEMSCQELSELTREMASRSNTASLAPRYHMEGAQ